MEKRREDGTISQDVHYLQMVDAVKVMLQEAPAPLNIQTLVMGLAADFNVTEDEIASTLRDILADLFQAVEVRGEQYWWLTNVLNGKNVRHPLTDQEATSGFLLLDELEHAVLFPEFFQTHQADDRILELQLFGGPRIPAEAYIENKTWALRLGDQFSEWVELLGGQGSDDLIIMVDDAAAGKYTMRLLPREIRDDNEIQSRNVNLSLLAEDVVRRTCEPNIALHTWDIAAALLASDLFNEMTPPDDMHCVLHQYSMLKFNGKVGYVYDPNDKAPKQTQSTSKTFPPFGFSDSTESGSADVATQGKRIDPEKTQELTVMDDLFGDRVDADYDYYVEKLHQIGLVDAPLNKQDFLLLKAELKALMHIERDCGHLLEEQRLRRHELISYLLIRPETLLDDSDFPDSQDYDDPPCWES